MPLPLFKKAMDDFLLSIECQSALLYLYEACAISKSFQQYLAHLQMVAPLLQHASVKLKVNKCSFFVKIINYVVQFLCLRQLNIVKSIPKAIDTSALGTDSANRSAILCRPPQRFPTVLCRTFCDFQRH